MRINKFCGLVMVFALSSGAAFSTLASSYAAPANQQTQGDGVPRITPEELRALLQKRGAILIDVRSEESYKNSHIKGARSIPVDQIEARVNELPRDKMIVTYCS